MLSYIVEQARKQSNGRSTAVEDRVVYEWAEDYYHKEEKPESVQKENDKKTTENKEVLIVEDIIDSGNTLYYLIDVLKKRNPASMRLCTLLDKPDRRVKDVKVDYCGFEIPDEFVVGYGLDYAQKYRNLPYIGVVEGVE